MIDFGFDKLAVIGAVALIVVGPERLPRVARTVGTLLGKAQRYVAEVKAEVNRSIELEELQKMKGQFEAAARDVGQSVQQEIHATQQSLNQTWSEAASFEGAHHTPLPPRYKHPGKRWRIKRSAMPLWYKQQQGVRRNVQSGAARVARFRPAGQSRLSRSTDRP
ncbi:MAG: Sec-independent protein translocase subunit TatB [Burkholderiaceae bacterium]|nr:Sec-independent protein translocase subunit TatB [Roseateles sp.]MBV8468585.1 Sec-independent protein translocase subunit TatB [Burkholderiaceae bacterium]